MKTSLQCPKCHSLRIGYFERVRDRGKHSGGERVLDTHGELEGGFFTGDWKEYTAEVEAYVCTDCGFFEEYVKNPKDVRWDKLERFRWVRPEAEREGPFR
jgi:predicted RNA-binding Zn-ribbon protein involved in translation (DUF1610 family)